MKFRQQTKRIFTAALVVWMSGIVLFLCCKMPTAQALEIESCPLAKKGHCTKTTTAENSEPSLRQKQQAFDCCAFPAKIFDKARKIEWSPQALAIAATVEIATPKFFIAGKVFKSQSFYQSFVSNHGSTHLHNRVFRI